MESNDTPTFDCTTVVFNYNKITTGRTRVEKNQANEFIAKFVASEQAWPIAIELLTTQPNQPALNPNTGNNLFQQHFIGAQALYQKLDRDFEELAKKDSLVVELRDKVFGLLIQSGEQETPFYHKTVLERLCMSLAYLALHTNNTCWQTSIKDIISFGSNYGPTQCFISLNILKNICITFENKQFSQKETAIIKRWLKENVSKVFEYANQILSGGGDLPREVYLACLSVAKHWCCFSKKSFIIHENFIQTILHLLVNDSSMHIYKKVINVIRKLLTQSDHVKLLSNMSFQKAIMPGAIPERDLQFIRHIIDYLHASIDKYRTCITEKMYSPDDDDEGALKATFGQKFTQLLVALCSNYEVLFVSPHNHQWGQKLFELLLIGAGAKNLNTVIETTEFWAELRQTLSECIQGDRGEALRQIDSQMQICSPYLQVCEVLLAQSHLQCEVHPQSGILIEQDEDDQEEVRGMSIKGFRNIIEDTYLQVYFLLRDTYKEEGAQKFYQMLVQKLERSQQDILGIEASLFMLKSIEVALQDDDFSSALQFSQQIYDKLLSPNEQFLGHLQNNQNVLLKRGFCQLVHDMAPFFTKFPQHLNQVLKLVLSVGESLDILNSHGVTEINVVALENLYCETTRELCFNCPQNFSQEEFLLLKSQLTQRASSISVKNLTCLMESACWVCTKQANQELLKIALNDVCSIPLQFMQSMSFEDIKSVDKGQLLKALSMIIGVIKALKDLDGQILATTLLPMVQSVWDKIMSILQSRFNDKELITMVCELIEKTLGALGPQLTSIEFFNNLSNHLINCFVSNSGNLSCLEAFGTLCTNMGGANGDFRVAVLSKQNEICGHVLQLIRNQQSQSGQQGINVDVDLLKTYALVLNRCSELDKANFITNLHFKDNLMLFSSTIEQVDSKELNQQLVRLFTSLLNTASVKFRRQVPEVQQAFMTYYGTMLKALMVTLSKTDIEKELHLIAAAYQNAIIWAENGGFEEKLQGEFLSCFTQSEVLSREVPEKLRTIVIGILFGLRGDTRKLRLCLLQLNAYILKGRGGKQGGGAEGFPDFMGLEMQASEASKARQINLTQNAQGGQPNRVEIIE